MSFDDLGLRPELLRAVAHEGYTEPTPIQAQAIPIVLTGRDLLAGAQTGTGKTAAFVLPILQRLHATRPARPGKVRVLVVTPTRELALQVEESVRIYGRYLPVRSVAIYGGVGMDAQVRALRAGVDVVVATPGRLLDHQGQGTIRLDAVEILVLDEADRMLDMGFIHDIRRILGLLPSDRQSLLFSATFSRDIRALAERLLRDPASVDVAPRNSAAELVRQVVHPVDKAQKRAMLSHLVRSGAIEQALVFARTKHGANRLAEQLVRDGIDAVAIHGNKSQGARVRALSSFKGGGAQVLVATDIAARGIDIEELPHVVNYELPNVPEDYVHRIGRTGRAGSGGTAISLVSPDEHAYLRDIEKLLRRTIDREPVAGFTPDPRAQIADEPERSAHGSRGGGGSGRGQTPARHVDRPRTGLGAAPARGGPVAPRSAQPSHRAGPSPQRGAQAPQRGPGGAPGAGSPQRGSSIGGSPARRAPGASIGQGRPSEPGRGRRGSTAPSGGRPSGPSQRPAAPARPSGHAALPGERLSGRPPGPAAR